MPNVPKNIHNVVKKYSSVPAPIWQAISYFESKLNPYNVTETDNGYKYGLFGLHIPSVGNTGLGNAALAHINQTTGLSDEAAITHLLQNTEVQAKFAMPPINEAWQTLKHSYNALDADWWIAFAVISGHPGGTPDNPITQQYVRKFMKNVVSPNYFGIQQVVAGAGPADIQTGTTQDNSWLQVLINMPPHQPCSVVWRRTCPGAITANEGGMDLTSPNGTKVYALGAGNIIGAGYFWHSDGSYGHGVVTVRTAMPDGSYADIYYQHIDISPSIILCGQTGGQLYNNVVGPAPTNQPIQAGQFLGTVAIGEVEVGINADWGGIWGTNHPGTWVDDPEDMIRSLMTNGGGTGTSVPISTGNANYDAYLQTAFTQATTAIQVLSQTPGLAGPIQVFDNAQKFKPFAVPDDNSSSANWPIIGGVEQGATYPARLALGTINFIVSNMAAFFIRSFFVIMALVIILALIINAVSQTTEEAVDEGGKYLPEIAEAALL